MSDISQTLQAQVQQAAVDKTALNIVAGNSKQFYGFPVDAQTLDVSQHKGITSYEPTELVLTARAGTPLSELEGALAEQRQCLPFEPPHFGNTATLGGSIACNFSGPARPYAGAARDLVLGCKIINGKGEILSFGGEVMKNVAGYDVSRLMCGAMGTLGVLLEVSLKVLPLPEKTTTLVMDLDYHDAWQMICKISSTPAPLSATCYDGKQLYLRFSGAETSVDATVRKLGGESLSKGEEFWYKLREQQSDFFQTSKPLWRISIAADAPHLELPGQWLYEWGHRQRWLATDSPAEQIQNTVAEYAGHATLFRGNRNGVFLQPLSANLHKIHLNLKNAFDPAHIFNPGKMYPDIQA